MAEPMTSLLVQVLGPEFQVFPFFLWPSYPSVSVSAIWRNSGSRVFHMQILDTDDMCFPREMANPFGHVLTRATTIVIILVSTTNGYSRKSASAMPYIMCWEIFGLCLSCVSTPSTPCLSIYLFICLCTLMT